MECSAYLHEQHVPPRYGGGNAPIDPAQRRLCGCFSNLASAFDYNVEVGWIIRKRGRREKSKVCAKRPAGARSASREFTCVRRVRLRRRSDKVQATSIDQGCSKVYPPEHACSVLDHSLFHSAQLDTAGIH